MFSKSLCKELKDIHHLRLDIVKADHMGGHAVHAPGTLRGVAQEPARAEVRDEVLLYWEGKEGGLTIDLTVEYCDVE